MNVQTLGKLEKSEIKIEQDALCCYNQGAHLISWRSGGEEQLFLSSESFYEAGIPFRGGVPLCFPQFGAFGEGKKHGFARNILWQRDSNAAKNTLRYTLRSSDLTHTFWPYEFQAHFEASLNESQLSLTLSVENIDTRAFSFTAALHSYFAVNNIEDVKLFGTQRNQYWDNGTPQTARSLQSSEHLSFDAAIDRVYFNVKDNIELHEASRKTRIINSEGFNDIVIWNPWSEGAADLKDMHENEYRNMLCIESAVIEKPVELSATESWQGSQIISLK